MGIYLMKSSLWAEVDKGSSVYMFANNHGDTRYASIREKEGKENLKTELLLQQYVV